MKTLVTEDIWHQFSGQLRNFISARVSDRMLVEDILQDVFLKIHGGMDLLRDSTKLQSWIYQVTRNAIIDHYRRQKDLYSLEEFTDPSYSPGDPAAIEEISRGLKNMINLLPDKYREALWLTEFEGLSQVELARRLNISVSGAKSRVQRGRKLLKEMLLDCCHFEFDRRGTIIDYHPIACQCQNNRVN